MNNQFPASTRRDGFTLVELIVTLLIVGTVIGMSVTFLTTGSNFLTRTETNAADKALAERSVDFIRDRLLYASQIEVVKSTTLPAIRKDQEVIFIGDVSGGAIELTHTGRLYYQRHDTTSPMALGSGVYKGNALALSYKATVGPGKGSSAKSASFDVETRVVRDGKQTQAARQTFDLPNIDPYGEPTESMEDAIASWGKDGPGETFYLIITPSTDGYVQDGLVMHLDAIENSTKGVGASHNPDTSIWSDLSGHGNDVRLMTTDAGFKLDPKPSDRVRSRSIYFDGKYDYATTSPAALDLSSYSAVTVEVCFKNQGTDKIGFLFEYSENWNQYNSGFGVLLNSTGGAVYVARGTIHTNLENPDRTSNSAVNYSYGNQDHSFTTHTNYFNVSSGGVASRLIWIDGARVGFILNGTTSTSTTTPNAFGTAAGSFVAQPFYLANRSGFIEHGYYNTSDQKYYNTAFNGEIASVRIYGRKLTDDEIRQNAEMDRRRFGD
ncbi:MAG: prepilin-type N-terminal cleavage/methylation domain-containing protein [Clostridiales Family XIII bacterium]|nr:prepilin-type N-terminal cleavage/methylation domain-containing protein [Clostridiales Family XIII bacterium]